MGRDIFFYQNSYVTDTALAKLYKKIFVSIKEFSESLINLWQRLIIHKLRSLKSKTRQKT